MNQNVFEVKRAWSKKCTFVIAAELYAPILGFSAALSYAIKPTLHFVVKGATKYTSRISNERQTSDRSD